MDELKVIIVGAGISGLAAAHFLSKSGADITVLESSERIGGAIHTVFRNGFCFEKGPHSLRPKSQLVWELCTELLSVDLVTPQASKKYILSKGKLRSPLRILLPLLPRMLLEPLCREKNLQEESVASFFSRRMGVRFVNDLIDPLIRGIYAGSAQNISMRAAFPRLYSPQSLFAQLLTPKKRSSWPSSFSFSQGMQALPLAIAKNLPIQMNRSVIGTAPYDEGVRVFLNDGSFLCADCVIWTAAPPNLLVPKQALTVINIGYRTPKLGPHAFGHLIPSSESSSLFGIIYCSQTFPQQDRHPQSRFTVMLPPTQDPLGTALKALEQQLRITAAPDAFEITNAVIPQHTVGHNARIAAYREKIAKENPHIFFTSWYCDGIGVNDCIENAHSVAALVCKKYSSHLRSAYIERLRDVR